MEKRDLYYGDQKNQFICLGGLLRLGARNNPTGGRALFPFQPPVLNYPFVLSSKDRFYV